jgi:hypothetical protein
VFPLAAVALEGVPGKDGDGLDLLEEGVEEVELRRRLHRLLRQRRLPLLRLLRQRRLPLLCQQAAPG